MDKGRRLGFVGGGNMAEAMLRGFLTSSLVSPAQIVVSDIREDRLAYLRQTFGVRTATSNAEAVGQSDTIILAVKPQVLDRVLDGLTEAVSEAPLLISIAGGVPISRIAKKFPRPVRIIRVMPNTPVLVLEGMSALASGTHATRQDLETARELFEAVGKVVLLDEALMDAVTGLSGSGPAYAFVIIEALADAGVKVGLSRDVAQLLAAQTLRGAARMVLETGSHPGQLKDMVASPGGTTIAGLHALEEGALRATLIHAVEAATRRSRELGGA
jgi:pyrroline-5-carboxylate reductase